jgi:uncharacterized protein (DUF1778 family)
VETGTNDVRIDIRLGNETKAVIKEAAALTGQSVSDFAVSALLEKATHILNAKPIRPLSERDARTFLSVLDSERQPNQELRKAAASYKDNLAAP